MHAGQRSPRELGRAWSCRQDGHLAHQACRLANVLVDDSAREDLEEVGLKDCGDGTLKKRLSGLGGSLGSSVAAHLWAA
jgi:hypothetical protein